MSPNFRVHMPQFDDHGILWFIILDSPHYSDSSIFSTFLRLLNFWRSDDWVRWCMLPVLGHNKMLEAIYYRCVELLACA